MDSRSVSPVKHYKQEAITYLRQATGSRKALFTFADAIKYQDRASDRIKVIIQALMYLWTDPLRENDYYKFVDAYFTHKVKLNEKYFRHDLDKLHKYYLKIDEDERKVNPFHLSMFESYVLFMFLKLYGVYEPGDDKIFNVKIQDNREYNPLTNLPSVLRGNLPFKVKEYDIRRAFPTFIDIELKRDFRGEVYAKVSKKTFSACLNANFDTSMTIEDARNGLKPVYGELVHRIVTDERYNEKGKAFRDFAKYEHEYIQKFIYDNRLTNYVRLHDGIFVMSDVECKKLNFGKVEFSIKECIKPEIVNTNVSFYTISSTGKVHTSPSMYADFLKQEKFIRVQTHDDKIQLLKDSNNIVEFFNHKTDMVAFLESEINEVNPTDVRNTIARDNTNILQQSYTLLQPVKLVYYKDTKDSFGLPFRNGFWYFSGFNNDRETDIISKPYSDVNGFFTPHAIQKREFTYTDEVGMFERFIERIATGKEYHETDKEKADISAFMTMIGYLCTSYKTYTECPGIVLTDEGANDETRNGGRGKTIIAMAVKEVTKVMWKGGNEFVGSYIHNFADLNESYRVYVLDDVPASFNYNDLYTNITGGINIQPKGSMGRMIEFKDSPKFLITTNWLFRYDENDVSTNRRFVEYKINPYYSLTYTPKTEFSCTFFEDWDAEEWNRFYSYIFRCVSRYLVFGLQRIKYDKAEDNYRAMFGSDVRESEMSRIMELLMYPTESERKAKRPVWSFSVTDFLKIYNHYENPLRGEKLFSHVNTKKFIDIYLKHYSGPKYHYEQKDKRWFRVDSQCDGLHKSCDGLVTVSVKV